MNRVLVALSFVVAVAVMGFTFPDGVVAVLLAVFCSLITVIILRRNGGDDVDFLTTIFLIALLVRIVSATASQMFNLTVFFGGDALTYDYNGAQLVDYWLGVAGRDDPDTIRATTTLKPGWGMNYLTAFIYLICGKN